MWKNHAFAQKQKQNLAPNIFTKWNIIIIIITQTLNYVLKGFTVFPLIFVAVFQPQSHHRDSYSFVFVFIWWHILTLQHLNTYTADAVHTGFLAKANL